MKRWLWIILAILVSTGVYYTIRYGLRPKPIPVMNPTEFTDLEQIGVVTYKRLRTEVRAERVVLLGTSQPEEAHVWEGFLKAAAADKEKIVEFVHQGLVQERSWEVLAFDDQGLANGSFAQQLRDHLKAGQLVVIRGQSHEVSHLVQNSLAFEVDRLVQHPVMALSTLRLALNAEERDNLQTQCVSAEGGSARLVCSAQRVGRLFMRKNLDPSKIWAVIERHGLKEYLLFLHHPNP